MEVFRKKKTCFFLSGINFGILETLLSGKMFLLQKNYFDIVEECGMIDYV